jgi:hypothetical protein
MGVSASVVWWIHVCVAAQHICPSFLLSPPSLPMPFPLAYPFATTRQHPVVRVTCWVFASKPLVRRSFMQRNTPSFTASLSSSSSVLPSPLRGRAPSSCPCVAAFFSSQSTESHSHVCQQLQECALRSAVTVLCFFVVVSFFLLWWWWPHKPPPPPPPPLFLLSKRRNGRH